MLTGVGACAASATGGTTSGGEGGDATTGGPTSTTAASGSSGTGAAPGGPSSCYSPCASADECGTADIVPFNSAHWTCTEGRCNYLGCTSDDECKAFSATTLCLTTKGAKVPTCEHPCSTASDCASTNNGALYDADHFSCDNSTCTHLGCNSDAECNWNKPAGTYACRKQAPSNEYAGCLKACSVPADCVLASTGLAFDADNFACKEGVCEYTGCNSNEECTSSNPTLPDITCQPY
jgi:hypothetical protein